MKGKFSTADAERLYGEWTEGLHTDEAFDGTTAYGLFIDGDTGWIISEDNYGFVDVAQHPTATAQVIWASIRDTDQDDWEE